MKKVAIIGIQGVPAKYGGFESLVENIIGDNCSSDIQYTIYCSTPDMKVKIPEYKGAKLKYIPLHANGIQSIPYDMVAMMRSLRGYDVILVLGTSGCLFMPILRLMSKSRIVVNIDGLEHRREKWGKIARTVLRLSEASAVKWAHAVITDNKGIQDYVTETYGKDSSMIAYGGDHVVRDLDRCVQDNILAKYGLKPSGYSMTVCRIEPENSSHIVLEAFKKAGQPLVYVGNWQHSEYSRDLKEKYSGCPNITMLESIYDLDTLYTLRSNAGMYVHGHTAGGTNPSLVEAMFFGRPILAFDVVYNRATTEDKAYYFSTPDQLSALINRRDLDGSEMVEIARRRYCWHDIARAYESLY